MKGKDFLEKIREHYSFLEDEFGFNLSDVDVSGNYYYRIHYSDGAKVVSISCEGVEYHLSVLVYILENGQTPNYDDKAKTIHLNALNKAVFPALGKGEIIANNEFFKEFEAKDKWQKDLLSSAKELRLGLKYFDQLRFDPDGVHFV